MELQLHTIFFSRGGVPPATARGGLTLRRAGCPYKGWDWRSLCSGGRGESIDICGDHMAMP